MFALLSKPTEHLFETLGHTKFGHQVGLLMGGPMSPTKVQHSPRPAGPVQKIGQETKMSESSDVKLLGINLTEQPKWIQLLVCTSGMHVCRDWSVLH